MTCGTDLQLCPQLTKMQLTVKITRDSLMTLEAYAKYR
jgi:hypothetical protein